MGHYFRFAWQERRTVVPPPCGGVGHISGTAFETVPIVPAMLGDRNSGTTSVERFRTRAARVC